MAVRCSICQDFLTERPQSLVDAEELVICALECGHLLHRNCLQQWFVRTTNMIGTQTCPCCKSRVSRPPLRVFPTCDEASDDMIRQSREAKALAEQNQTLADTAMELQEHVDLVKGKLESEIASNKLLRQKFAGVKDHFDILQKRLDEYTKYELAYGVRAQCAVDKLREERGEAFQLVAKVEADMLLQQQTFQKKIAELRLQAEEKKKRIMTLEASRRNSFEIIILE